MEQAFRPAYRSPFPLSSRASATDRMGRSAGRGTMRVLLQLAASKHFLDTPKAHHGFRGLTRLVLGFPRIKYQGMALAVPKKAL